MTSTNLDRLRPVSSRQNSLVKELRAAFHAGVPTDDFLCAIDGLKIVEEAIRSGWRLKAVFVAESSRERAGKLLPQLSSHTETLLLPDEVFRSAVLTESPQGIAALARIREHSLDDVLRHSNPLVIIAAGLQDPGNLGTIIRSAEAFGASGLLAVEGTVNPFNPKVIRGSAGSVFRLPLRKATATEALSAVREHGLRILATSSHKSTPLQEADLSGPLAIIIGNEGAGVSRDLLAQADQNIGIPHSSRVESLNAGIAASVILYECARQRA
jgi:TrmH family RNA methyltransferase